MMINPTLALFLFCLLCLALLLLPFVPAVNEWRSPTDCSPLPIARRYASEIDFFSHQFRHDAVEHITLGHMSPGLFDYVPEPSDRMDWLDGMHPVIGLHPIKSESTIRCNRALYVLGDFECGRDSSFVSMLCDGAIRLGPYSEVLEWAHADGAIHLDTACVALRRLSSDIAIDLAAQCCFERISAPVIRFGKPGSDLSPPETFGYFPANLAKLPGAIRRTDTLTLIKGDCTLPAGHIYKGSLVVTGRLIVGNHTTLIGDIKVRQGIIVGNAARIIGSLVCEERIYLLDHSEVTGPIISETDIVLGAGAVIGRIDAPTTISAENIIAKVGAVSHGSIWARNVGFVWAS